MNNNQTPEEFLRICGVMPNALDWEQRYIDAVRFLAAIREEAAEQKRKECRQEVYGGISNGFLTLATFRSLKCFEPATPAIPAEAMEIADAWLGNPPVVNEKMRHELATLIASRVERFKERV